MSLFGDSDLLIRARSVLLDALDALVEHRDSLVVVGAQAIYLHTGAVDLPLAETTKDSDIAVDPRELSNDPLLETAMSKAGFYLDLTNSQPGSWLSIDGIPVDLMVPEALSGAGGRRGARIPPHSKNATRKTLGLEAAIVDHTPIEIGSLDPTDARVTTVKVAGPAALLVAKLHKLGDRTSDTDRLVDKDAHDIYRLLAATDMKTVAARLHELSSDQLAGPATLAAIEYLRELFARETALGSIMVGRAEQYVGNPEFATAAVTALVIELLEALEP